MEKGNVSYILDNRAGKKIGERLGKEIKDGSQLRVVSAYFTLYAYGDLQDRFDAIGGMKFLFGDPSFVGEVNPEPGSNHAFSLKEDSMYPLQTLQQKRLAKECAEWIEKKCDIRTVHHVNFLHGKMYHVEQPDGESFAVAGSSNFTRRGLGFGSGENIELNLSIERALDREALAQWFDELWSDAKLVRDAKSDVLNALARLWREQSPEFVYYKTLFHIFKDELDQRKERDALLDSIHLYDTQIWKALYPFQKHGVQGAINRLLRHNGCIIADSVGLGKTFEALAIIKFFLLQNDKVLVLCPKRLTENWTQYTSWANQKNNPFDKDRFDYQVLAHTDLSRERGQAGGIQLENFNWSNYGLVVIDESHNFRNESKHRRDDAGKIVAHSRYQKLLEEVIGSGVKTKVLMLSATPVNNTLRDLLNQIYLITEKQKNAFRDSLGIEDISKLLHAAQARFHAWQKGGKDRRKEHLFEQLGGDFLRLLDGISIARGRRHLEQHYAKSLAEIGGFPSRDKPVNCWPDTDKEGKISYSELHRQITEFRLSIYTPSKYLKSADAGNGPLQKKMPSSFQNQETREHWLIGMMRTNLLKRLESSAHALRKTLERTINKIEEIENKIDEYLQSHQDREIESVPEENDEDEEFVVGRRLLYPLKDLDCEHWKEDLARDRESLEGALRQVSQVTVERDAKLAELQKIVIEKLRNPSQNKKGEVNRKILIFTASADTAEYLHDNIKEMVSKEDAHIAQISGGGSNHTDLGKADFGEILDNFSPISRNRSEGGKEIDVLIATDCISEGQNLQDCDMVVNYDIHWNPVRLIQRFGRIDRIGNMNCSVKMVNFWPTKDLEKYLDLKNRVEARMALADATATGVENFLEAEEEAEATLKFRDDQLRQLQEELIDFDGAQDSLTMSDFTLDDFLAELMGYLETNRKSLEEAPLGLYAVIGCDTLNAKQDLFEGPVSPGVIFCLRQKKRDGHVQHSPTHPYYLVYIKDSGDVRMRFAQARQILILFGRLSREVDKPMQSLCDAFNSETKGGRKMDHYNDLVSKTLRDILARKRQMDAWRLGSDRRAILPQRSKWAAEKDFELVSWLVIRENP